VASAQLVTMTKDETLVRFIRMQPQSTQACRDHMNLGHKMTSHETELMLVELRNEGTIAFANGKWYVLEATRVVRKRPKKKPDERQTDFFNPDAGHEYTGPSRQLQLFVKRWNERKRA
jgi:hypothetical protein